MKYTLTILTALLLTPLALLDGADKPKQDGKPKPSEVPVFITVESAGSDYALQGEYEGTLGARKLGADVIALGADNFHVVFHRGGLPGAGWDKSEKIEISGKREGDNVGFKGTWNASLTKSTLTGKTDKEEAFELKRIERHSPTEGAKAPAGAVLLFDGSNTDAWANAEMDDRHLLKCGTKTKQDFEDFTMHIEFILPFKPLGRGQGRGNSGLYLQNRYEVQVLDSFGLKGADNECGGIYKHNAPLVNMCFPPLQWQTYDIDFTAARFDDAGKKTKNGIVTVKHNGVVVHDHLELTSTTPGGGFKEEVAAPGPLQLQNHSNPVFFRNAWVMAK